MVCRDASTATLLELPQARFHLISVVIDNEPVSVYVRQVLRTRCFPQRRSECERIPAAEMRYMHLRQLRGASLATTSKPAHGPVSARLCEELGSGSLRRVVTR